MSQKRTSLRAHLLPPSASSQLFHELCSGPSKRLKGCRAEGGCPSLPLVPPRRQCLGQPAAIPARALGKTGTTGSLETKRSFKATPLRLVRFVSAWLLIPLQAQETNAGLCLAPLPSKCYFFGTASVLHLAEAHLCL